MNSRNPVNCMRFLYILEAFYGLSLFIFLGEFNENVDMKFQSIFISLSINKIMK